MAGPLFRQSRLLAAFFHFIKPRLICALVPSCAPLSSSVNNFYFHFDLRSRVTDIRAEAPMTFVRLDENVIFYNRANIGTGDTTQLDKMFERSYIARSTRSSFMFR
jgi:hypothetical protein